MHRSLDGPPERSIPDVLCRVRRVALTPALVVAQLGVVEPADRVERVEQVLRPGRRLYRRPLQRQAESVGDRVREAGLATARVALEQEWASEGDGDVDRVGHLGSGKVRLRGDVVAGDVVFGD